MRRLLACTCLTPLAVAAIGNAVHAETSITTKVTAPISTATANNGAADNVRITSTGSINPTGGVAVTINSANSVANEGTIQITDANNAVGIRADAGTSGGITSSGKIIIDETFAPTDTDTDGDVDGPFASGAGRFGILLAPGGTYTGNVTNSGEITIEGNQSAGIAADSRIAGSLNSSGTINVIGNNSVGIRAGDITGNVQLTGAIGAKGANATGVALNGDIGGALVVQGAIVATGYRSTAAPADTTKLDADDLLQGGPALLVSGDVAGGIRLAAQPRDLDPNDTDEDDDGVADASESNANVTSFGAAPAIQIGAADHAVAIGAVAGNAAGHGLVIDGLVSGNGVYSGVTGNGVTIGGLGGAVTIAGGMTVNGTVRADAIGAGATAIRIGNGATVNEIRVGGTVAAAGGNTAASLSRAILIDQQAVTTTIRNSGTISATTTGDGSAGAIVDASGRVTLIETSGKISATGAPAASGRNVAIDLRANTSGAIVRQTQVGQDVAVPQITGDILFGTGNDQLDVADGTIAGTTRFGAGDNRLTMGGDAVYTGAVQFGAGSDRLAMGGTSSLAGALDFGGGTDLMELSGTARFSGTLSNSSGLAVQLNGGTLDTTTTGSVALASLNVTGQGALGVTINGTADTSTLYQVAGAASFAQGSQLQVRLTSISDSAGTYTVLHAGSLTGAGNVAFNSTTLPFLFKGSVATNAAGNELAVTISRKSAAELGLNGSESRAYDAIFAVLDRDKPIADTFLGITSADGFRGNLRQMLPDHAGGAFEAVTQGSRATTRFLTDPRAPFADHGRWGFWLQQVAWGSSKDLGDTAAYDISGWGAAGGVELITGGAGNAGLSLAYLAGRDEDGETDNQVRSDQFELGAYWRGQWGGIRAYGRAAAATISFDGTRFFTGDVGGTAVTRTATGSWGGRLLSAAAGLSYEFTSGRLSLRPTAALDYYRLSEDGYTETGGGDAFNLIVDDRTSDELAATATLAAGYNFGRMAPDAGWMRVELEGGRRQILAGALGATTAHFATGNPFTLLPEERTDGWVGRLRLIGGTPGFTVGGEASAEEQLGRAAVAFRVSLQIGL